MVADKFFETLFSPIIEKESSFAILLVEKDSDGRMVNGERVGPLNRSAIFNKIDQANKSNHDLYFHCGVGLSDDACSRFVRYKKIDVDGVCFLWLDLDREVSEDELQDILHREDGPSLAVCSGRGYHLYWLLDSFYTDIEHIEECNRWLAQKFNGDKCVDVSRILRVPGSNNCKGDPIPVSIIHWNSRRSPIEDFGRVKSSLAKSNLAITDFKELNLGDDFLLESRFKAVGSIAAEINNPMFDEDEEDQSDRDWRVAGSMVNAGFSPDEVYSVLTHPSWSSGSKGRKNKNYAALTVKKAFAKKKDYSGLMASMSEFFKSNSAPVAVLDKEVEDPESEPCVADKSKIRSMVMRIHEDVLQEGGTYRPNKHAPRLGGVFGEKVAEAVRDAGYRFVYDPEFQKSFIADRKGGVWEALPGTESYAEFVTEISGYSSGQSEAGYITGGLQRFIKYNGERLQIGRWVHYNQETGEYHILTDGQAGKITIIDGNGNTRTEFNGAGDVFLRPRTQAFAPISFDLAYKGAPGLQVFHDSFINLIAGPKQAKRFLECLVLALVTCYGTEIRTLPLLHLTGPSGGGKSTTLGCITSILFGYYQILIYTTAGAFRVAPDETFMAHDDKEDVKDGMEEFLLLCATSAARTMCDKNNSEDVVIQKAHVVNAITSIEQMRTTALRRRTLVVEIDADKYPSSTNLTAEHTSAIVRKRDQIWSGFIPVFADIARSFKGEGFRRLSRKVYGCIDIAEFKGLADFLALMVETDRSISGIVGRVFNEDETIKDFINVAGLRDRDEILGRDPLVLCLESFFERMFSVNSTEVYNCDGVEGDVRLISINRSVHNSQWALTEEEENTEVKELVGCDVRGIKASSTGWVSIFSTDTREFARTINSPPSLGRQFSRVEGRTDFPFYITRGKRHKDFGRTWNVFQKIQS